MRIFLALTLLLASLAVGAADEIYRWVGKDGVIHYDAKPPSKDAKPATLPEIQTYPHRSGTPAFPVAGTAEVTKTVAAAGVKEVRILAPVEDEIFRDGQGTVNVSAAVLPGLPEGAGVVFYLDGAAKNAKPSPRTSMTLSGVERGEHTVTVAVVDAAGKELKRAAPVIFYTKPGAVDGDGLGRGVNPPAQPRPPARR